MKKLMLLFALSSLVLTGCNNATPVEESSSSVAPAAEVDRKQVLNNIQNLDKYHLATDFLLNVKSKILETVDANKITKINLDFLANKENYKVTNLLESYYEAKLSDVAAKENKTVDEILALAEEDESITVDKEKDLYKEEVELPDFLDENLFNGSKTYRHLEDTDQYVVYTSEDDEITDTEYSDEKPSFIDNFFTFITSMVESSETNEEGDLTHTFTPDDKAEDSYAALVHGLKSLFKAIVIKVKDNLPNVIEFVSNSGLFSRLQTLVGGIIKELGLKINLDKDEAKTDFVVPEGEPECFHHIAVIRPLEDNEAEGHQKVCTECGKKIISVEAHDYDETHHVCKLCGYVALGEEELVDEEYLLLDKPESKLKIYAFSYKKSDLNEYYEISPFHIIKNSFDEEEEDDTADYQPVATGDDEQIVYIASLKTVMLAEAGEEIAIANSCITDFTYNYKLYKDVEINDEGEEPMVGEVTLVEYLKTATPTATFLNHQPAPNHSTTKEKTILHPDACHTIGFDVCDKCGEEYSYDLIEEHDFEYTISSIEDVKNDQYGKTLENEIKDFLGESEAVVIKHTCKNDGYYLFYIFKKDNLNEVSDHTEDALEVFIVGHDETGAVYRDGAENHEHVYDSNDVCVLCPAA